MSAVRYIDHALHTSVSRQIPHSTLTSIWLFIDYKLSEGCMGTDGAMAPHPGTRRYSTCQGAASLLT
jgi:hypothetical protein